MERKSNKIKIFIGLIVLLFLAFGNYFKSDEDIYINPNYPRILYFLQANISCFVTAKKNNLKFKDLFKKI